MISKNLTKRVAALERSARVQPGLGAKVIEKSSLPDQEKQVLLQGLQSGVVVLNRAEADQLNAALDALPAAERARVNQAIETVVMMTVTMSEIDARL